LDLVLKTNVDVKKIIFSNPIKNFNDLIYAYEKGVRLSTADSISELLKMKQLAPEMKVLWRIVTDNHPDSNVLVNLSDKYGQHMG
jgi:diaminopimelate decarboxylase